MAMILQEKLHSCAELMEYINEIGFLPLDTDEKSCALILDKCS